jgi:integrase
LSKEEATMTLTEKTIRNAKPGVKDYKLFDGGGLFLLVTPKGGKYWRYKYRLAGTERKASLGAYPETSLAEAREKHVAMRKQVDGGDDPVDERQKDKREKEAVRAAQRPFREVAQEWYDAMIPASASDSTKDRAKRAIRNFNAVFGNKPVTEVGVTDLAKVLAKHEKAGKFATRERDQLTAIKIAGFCVGRGYIKANPFRDVKYTDAFTAPSLVHNSRPAIVEPLSFGKLLRDCDRDHDVINRYAFRLLNLMAVRPGELVQAEWRHIDWQERKLIVPAAVLKMTNHRKKNRDKRAGKDLEVPLSRQAVAELRALQKLTGNGTHLFPARRSNRARKHPHMQRAAINNALVRLGYAGTHCSHGFRSSFSTIMNAERVVGADGRKGLCWPYQEAMIELQLDHNDDSTQAIYDRGGMWEERCELMQLWADRTDEMRGNNAPKLRVIAA